jgi:hypothetical protein
MPSPTQGIIAKPWVSALDSLLDDITSQKQLIGIRRNMEFMDIVYSTSGRTMKDLPEKTVGNAIYYGWMEDTLNQQISLVGATVVGSGTASITVTVLPAGSQNVLVVGDVLALPSGGAIQVKTVAAAGFTAISVDGTNVTVTAGQYLPVITNAFESGSSSPNGKRWGATRINNVWQIIRNKIQITDVEKVNTIRFDVQGQPKIFYYQSEQLRLEHQMMINGALFLGRLGSTLFSDSSPANAGSNGRGIQLTRGVDQYIESFGVNDSLATLGTVTLADFDDLLAQLVAARAPKDYMLTGSTNVMTKYSTFFKNLASSGVTSTRMIVDGMETNLDVEKAVYGGTTFNMSVSSYLDNNEAVGSAATSLIPAAKRAYGFPLGYAPVVGGTKVPYMTTVRPEKIANDGPNRTVRGATMEINHGGLADTATSGDLVLNLEMVSHIGLELNNPQAFFRQTVLS